jgi:hypothetical protein
MVKYIFTNVGLLMICGRFVEVKDLISRLAMLQVSAGGQEKFSPIAFPSNVVCELPCSRAVARGEVGEVDTEGMILPVREYDKQGRAGVRLSHVP